MCKYHGLFRTCIRLKYSLCQVWDPCLCLYFSISGSSLRFLITLSSLLRGATHRRHYFVARRFLHTLYFLRGYYLHDAFSSPLKQFLWATLVYILYPPLDEVMFLIFGRWTFISYASRDGTLYL